MNTALFLDKLTPDELTPIVEALAKRGHNINYLLKQKTILQNIVDLHDTLRDEVELKPELTQYFDFNTYFVDRIEKDYYQVYVEDTGLFFFKKDHEHEMEDAGDDEHRVPFCTICGFGFPDAKISKEMREPR